MKYLRLTRILVPVVLIVISVQACNFPSMTSSADIAATQTLQALATMASETTKPGTDDQPDQPIKSPSPDTTAPETTPSVIIHKMHPGEPVALISLMTDLSSAAFADEHRTIGDSYAINIYERPFTAGEMNYQPHLDIVYAELGLDPPWVYTVIYLEEGPPEGVVVTYSIEIDLDLDGRGDWLITATLSLSTEWTTDGVRALRDTNDDVGGPTPLCVDEPDPGRDGYDDRVFNNGYGPDPDAAWIRRDPDNQDRVQIAFKHTLIDSDDEFMWGAWAIAGVINPRWYDYHDHFTIEEAGDPASTSDYYPIKALAEVDNTCRWAFGFTPIGNEPGLCGQTTTTDTPPTVADYCLYRTPRGTTECLPCMMGNPGLGPCTP